MTAVVYPRTVLFALIFGLVSLIGPAGPAAAQSAQDPEEEVLDEAFRWQYEQGFSGEAVDEDRIGILFGEPVVMSGEEVLSQLQYAPGQTPDEWLLQRLNWFENYASDRIFGACGTDLTYRAAFHKGVFTFNMDEIGVQNGPFVSKWGVAMSRVAVEVPV